MPQNPSLWRKDRVGAWLTGLAVAMLMALAATGQEDGVAGVKARARRLFLRAEGPVFWVAPSGNDANPGTAEQPWRTISKAARSATPGSTVLVRAGNYGERVHVEVSGTAGAPITFAAYSGDRVVLDGSSLVAPEGASAMLEVDGRSYLRFVDIEVSGYRTAARDDVVAGVLITGLSHHIEIRGCHVHHVGSDAAPRPDLSGRNAHGIAAYGSSGATPIHDLTLVGNEVAYCTLGSSEAVALNGNVEGFEISDNEIHDNDNIGIDLIGWEGTAPANDQARSGVVRGNRVYRNSAAGNPVYTDLAAGGIYVDGGRDVVIEGNRVHHNDYGIEVGCENPGRTVSGVVVRDNFVYLNNVTGLGFGGYDADRGVATGNTFRHNTLYHNDTTRTGSGEIVIQVGHDNVLSHNIMVTNEQAIVLTNYFSASESHDNTLDHNLYFAPTAPSGVTFVWQDLELGSFDAYRAASGQDAATLFTDPLLANLVAPDLHLLPGSPAVDAGDPSFVAAPGETDIDRDRRVCGGRVDIGADELRAFEPASEQTIEP